MMLQNVTDKIFRVISQVRLEEEPKIYPVPDLLTGLIVIDAISRELLRFNDHVVPCNTVILQCYDEIAYEWYEWESEDGYTARYYHVDEAYFICFQD